jgi:hypothetical protein
MIEEDPSTTRRPGYVRTCVVQSGVLRQGMTGFHEW